MDIIIIHLGSPTENTIASSILRGIEKIIPSPNITWAVNDDNCMSVLRYNQRCTPIKIESLKKYKGQKHYDLLINLHPDFNHEEYPSISFDEAIGFNYDESIDVFSNVIYGEQQCKFNLFQIYYKISKMTWKGEGCDIGYYPRSKMNKKKIGIAVVNANLRSFVSDQLSLDKITKIDNMSLWYVPHKKNILKKLDEINKCKEIITDDFLTMTLAIYLRKYVYFLESIHYNTNLEFFGCGKIFKIPSISLI